MAAAVVNSLVLEAGVNSLPASRAVQALCRWKAKLLMLPKPRAQVGRLENSGNAFVERFMEAACNCVHSNRHSEAAKGRRIRRMES
mgnify:CR=1 FL=1